MCAHTVVGVCGCLHAAGGTTHEDCVCACACVCTLVQHVSAWNVKCPYSYLSSIGVLVYSVCAISIEIVSVDTISIECVHLSVHQLTCFTHVDIPRPKKELPVEVALLNVVHVSDKDHSSLTTWHSHHCKVLQKLTSQGTSTHLVDRKTVQDKTQQTIDLSIMVTVCWQPPV